MVAVNMDRETIFQLVQKREWMSIINIIKNDMDFEFIQNDSILRQFIDKHFVSELIQNSTTDDKVTYKYFLRTFHTLHNSPNSRFCLSADNHRNLILRIIETEDNKKNAYDYAKYYPEEEICKKVIAEYEREKPQYINHSQESQIIVTSNNNVIEGIEATTSLFKSQQEYLFFKAAREVFPTFFVIPNVALNAVINYDIIKGSLSKEEKEYFFKALIDCVIIDTEKDYKPMKFIELDSPYHDREDQIKKDKNKDNILAKAGQRLIRVRRLNVKEDEKDFVILIRDAIKDVIF